MSGIIGQWNSHCPSPWEEMLADLSVLGSDDAGDWHDSVVGLKLGRAQCYNTPESRLEDPVVRHLGCVLVWSGRLDDRTSLLAGRSQVTDAQIVIESYRRWGVDCLRHLFGEYVFSLWDAQKDLLFIGCDVVGAQTISYCWTGQMLLFSSRAVTLLRHPQIDNCLDEDYLAHILCNIGGLPTGITPFKDIKRLRPGFAITVSRGQFQLRQVASLQDLVAFPYIRSFDEAQEEFWDLLGRSVKDRLRSCLPICTTLSGGLDSTTVNVAVLQHLPEITAFSNTTTVFPEFDEREPIQSFLKKYPLVKWRSSNSDTAWSFTEDWKGLPVIDDPVIGCTLPMHLRLMRKMHAMNFGLIFDGEWGDELFCCGLSDSVSAGDWLNVLKHFTYPRNRRADLWWGVILPLMPRSLQGRWRKQAYNRTTVLPTWLKAEYVDSAAVKSALDRCFSQRGNVTTLDRVTSYAESTLQVGSRQIYKLLRSFYGLATTSPLQDVRLIQFASALHPSLKADPERYKVFMRRVNKETLPKDVLRKPKVNFFDSVKYAGLAKGKEPDALLNQLSELSMFEDRISMETLKSSLEAYRVGYAKEHIPGKPYQPALANQAYGLLSLVRWCLIISEV